MKTPILFLIFNRPDETRRVFAEIRAARPERLFIAADGPRTDRPEDARLCAETRDIVKGIDWPCEVETLFRGSNLGCRTAVSSGIDWFFSHVEEGVILEDDCLPDRSFFRYCEELLERYRDDDRVMMIAGFNAAGTWPGNSSYVFFRYVSIWGWATWRRAWQSYDVRMASWNDPGNKARIRQNLGDERAWRAKKWTYDRVAAGLKDTWDYQWEYASLLRGGLCAVPCENLIQNIGFGSPATHTGQAPQQDIPDRRAIKFPLIHPDAVEPDAGYEGYWAQRFLNKRSLVARISARIRKWLA